MDNTDTGLYISVDIEADGPIPGENSMLSLGAVKFCPADWDFDKSVEENSISSFYRTLLPLANTTPHPGTMRWWESHPEAWKEATRTPEPASRVMNAFYHWTAGNGDEHPVLVGYPATYDHMFIYWYSRYFIDRMPPFGFGGLDIKTLAAAKLGLSFRQAVKRRFPKRWFKDAPKHTHHALDDAKGQALLFMNILREDVNATDG